MGEIPVALILQFDHGAVLSSFSGHLPGVATPVRTCAANGFVGHQSMKKPIRVFLRHCRWFL